MSKIIFVNNSEELEKYTYDVFKAKPTDRNEEGVETTDEEILMRKNQDVE
jgi:hypothetical protein